MGTLSSVVLATVTILVATLRPVTFGQHVMGWVRISNVVGCFKAAITISHIGYTLFTFTAIGSSTDSDNSGWVTRITTEQTFFFSLVQGEVQAILSVCYSSV